jgi:L-serine/L-threonine ammonia-lyase
MVTLPAITSIAKTLGAARVSEAAFNWTKKHKVIPVVVTDKQAVNALEKFADDHRVLVEPACSATLAAIYDGKVASELLHGADLSDGILAIVCGGNVVSLDLIQMWKRQLQN